MSVKPVVLWIAHSQYSGRGERELGWNVSCFLRRVKLLIAGWQIEGARENL